jgi:hypothetical protein
MKQMISQDAENEDPRFLKLIYDISLNIKDDSVQLILHFLDKRLFIYGLNVKDYGVDFQSESGTLYEQWYPQFIKSFNAFEVSDEELKRISILSTFLTDISKNIAHNLIISPKDNKLENETVLSLPNSKLGYHVAMKPLSLNLIKSLSVHSRNKFVFKRIKTKKIAWNY